MNDLKDLYRDAIRRHAAEPVGFRRPIAATHRCEGHNPQCGDRVEIALLVADGVIEDAVFDGEACAICLASASLMCERLPGVTSEEAVALKDSLSAALKNRLEAMDIGTLSPLLGVRPYPSRVQCAMLPWQTAVKAIRPEPA